MEEANPIEEAKKILADLKAENDRTAELIKKHQQIKAEQILSGKSEAGIVPPIVDKEKERIDRVNKLLESTGMHI